MSHLQDHEYSIFSQNGEDGIISFLASGLQSNRRRFVEIGTSDGGQNNSMYLLKRGWSGLGLEMDPNNIKRYVQRLSGSPQLAARVQLGVMKVGWDNCVWIVEDFGEKAPDFFSLDIDSVDYYVAYRLMQLDFAPSIICVEYNAFLGSQPLTVVYDPEFSRHRYDPDRGLYFGASVAAWRHLFAQHGYRFCGVDSAGVNAFFCLPDRFQPGFLDSLSGADHAYTRVFTNKYGLPGEKLERDLLSRKDVVFINVAEENVEHVVEDCDRPAAEGPIIFSAQLTSPVPAPQVPAPAPARLPGERPTFDAAATFHAEGYERFGRQFMASFERHWPLGTKLWVFAEGCRPEGSSRVIVRDLHEDARDLVAFKQRHSTNPGAHGKFGETYQYMLDAIRWSHRIYALREAAERSDAEYLINIDADIVCFQDMPLEFLMTLMPADADIGYMPRKGAYSECSFVLYKLKNPLVRDFIRRHADYYSKDKIFTLARWTDCHAFDSMVAEHKKRGDLSFYNINEGVPDSMHPFVNGPLGRYMDHLKGGRKEEGRSRDSDLVVERKEAYWNRGNSP